MERNIPVRMVEFRDVDSQLKRFYGGDNEPSFVLHGKKLESHVKELRKEFQAISSEINRHLAKQEKVCPAIISVNLNPKATSKSYRGNVAAVFASDKQNDIIGIRGSEELMISINSSEHFSAIDKRLFADESNAYGLSAIKSLSMFEPKVNGLNQDTCTECKLRVVSFFDDKIDAAIHNRVLSVLHDEGEENGAFVDYAPHMRVYRVGGIRAQAVFVKLSQDGFLYSFEEMPRLHVVMDGVSVENEIPPKRRESGREYPKLGIFDSGVEPNEHLAPWIIGRNESFIESDRNTLHGSMVASVAIYGDELVGRPLVGNKDGIDIFDAQVFPKDYKSVTEFDLIRNIEEILSDHHNVAKVWNLSVGFSNTIDDDRFSDLAVALDSFQQKYGILICKSAGNSDSYLEVGEFERIHLGADSLMSLTVGSVAHKKNACDLAEMGAPSPFTCIGPGQESTIKPEVAHYGGNAGKSPSGKILATGVGAIAPDGSWVEVAGTSFSTPRVAALAANLDYELGDKSNSLLLKALIVHSAKYPNPEVSLDEDILDKIGYGVPLAINDILYDAPDEATMIFTGAMQKSRILEIQDFKMPKSLIRDGFFTGQIFITLAINPVLASLQGLEYCQSTIDVRMGTYERPEEKVDKMGTLVRLIDRTNVLNQAKYTRNERARIAMFNQERALIQNSGKYWPIKKYAVDLSEMTATNRLKLLGADRKWYLVLDSSFRDWSEREGSASYVLPSVEFCLIVTVKDSSGRGMVNGEIARFLDQNNFVYTSIPIRSETRVAISG